MTLIQRILIFIIGFSLPYNQVTMNIGFLSGTVSLFCVIPYFICMSTHHHLFSKLTKLYGRQVHYPLLLFVLITIMNFVYLNPAQATPVFKSSLFWCVLLYYILLIHQIIDDKAMRIALIGFAFGDILVAIFFMIGYQVEVTESGRITIFNENTNAVGIFLAIATIIIINDIIIKDILRIKLFRFLFVLTIIPFSVTLLASGSRTAFAIIVLGIIGSIIFYPTKKRIVKFYAFIIGALFLIYGANYILGTDSILLERIMRTADEGDSSGRDELVIQLLPSILENPLLGFGDTGYLYISKRYLGGLTAGGMNVYGASPHNVILEVLLLSGIVGLFIMMRFWMFELISAWKKTKLENDALPLLLTIPIILCLLSSQLLTIKWAYLLYSFFLIPKNEANKKVVNMRHNNKMQAVMLV